MIVGSSTPFIKGMGRGKGFEYSKLFLKKGVSLIFIITNPCSVSILSGWYACVCFVSREEVTLIESNEQIYDFCKRVIFKKQRPGKYIVGISELSIQCHTHSDCERITSGVNIYLYGCVSLLAPQFAVCICVYV